MGPRLLCWLQMFGGSTLRMSAHLRLASPGSADAKQSAMAGRASAATSPTARLARLGAGCSASFRAASRPLGAALPASGSLAASASSSTCRQTSWSGQRPAGLSTALTLPSTCCTEAGTGQSAPGPVPQCTQLAGTDTLHTCSAAGCPATCSFSSFRSSTCAHRRTCQPVPCDNISRCAAKAGPRLLLGVLCASDLLHQVLQPCWPSQSGLVLALAHALLGHQQARDGIHFRGLCPLGAPPVRGRQPQAAGSRIMRRARLVCVCQSAENALLRAEPLESCSGRAAHQPGLAGTTVLQPVFQICRAASSMGKRKADTPDSQPSSDDQELHKKAKHKHKGKVGPLQPQQCQPGLWA